MRRWLVLAASLSLVMSVGSPAHAGRPSEETFSFSVFSCELAGEGITGFVSLFAEDGFGTFVEAALWLGDSDPAIDPPNLFSDPETSTATFGETEVTAQALMVDLESGEPAGAVMLTGTIGQLLSESSFSDRFREGNRWVEIEETTREFEASAEVTFDSVALEATCLSTSSEGVFRSTNPHALRISFTDAFVECVGIPGSEGSTLDLFAGEFADGAFVQMQILSGGEVPDLVGGTEVSGLIGLTEVDVPLFDPFDETQVTTTAALSMLVELGAVTQSEIIGQDIRVKEIATELLVSGSVEVEINGEVFVLEGCFGSQFEVRGLFNDASGPKESGQAPTNDDPAGAVTLGVGSKYNQQTKAAAAEADQPCEPLPGEALPLGKTVWYAVEGTGEPITIDTAGSNFDTIVGVYSADLTQIACVDDVFDAGFSLQSRVTWDSEPGERYLVQAGGFAAEYGLLKVQVSG